MKYMKILSVSSVFLDLTRVWNSPHSSLFPKVMCIRICIFWGKSGNIASYCCFFLLVIKRTTVHFYYSVLLIIRIYKIGMRRSIDSASVSGRFGLLFNYSASAEAVVRFGRSDEIQFRVETRSYRMHQTRRPLIVLSFCV